MLPSSGESVSESSNLKAYLASGESAQSELDLMPSLNLEQIFQLIDQVLSFEVCLYHQLLPLKLEEGQLIVGMVNPRDQSAIDYVRPMLSFIHCTLVPQPLSTKAHSTALSAYLNYTGKKPADKASKKPQSFESSSPIPSERPHPNRLTTDPSNNPTLLVDSPIYFLEQEGYLPKPAPAQRQPLSTNASRPSPEIEQTDIDFPTLKQPTGQATHSNPLTSSGANQELELLATEDPQLALSLESKYPSLPLEQLLHLTPPDLLQELLVRVLTSGIGRLYFEQQAHYGRILWSQDGRVQAVLQQVSPSCIDQMINGLKHLTHTLSTPRKSQHQVEIERFYQGERLLLRLRLMPGTYGEEATLQILRGAALRFYQQQQLAALGRDALGLAQQLQNKIDEIRNQTHRYPQVADDQLTMLPAIDQVIRRIEAQIATLKTLRGSSNLFLDPGQNGFPDSKRNLNKRET